MCRKHERTRQPNISVFSCCIAFSKAIHGYNISFSTLKSVLLRNDKTARPLASVECFQKELFDAVESELAGSSNDVGCILISNGIMYCRKNIGKTVKQKDIEGVETKKST